MMSGDAPVVAIVGGGVSGAAVAYHLARSGIFQPGRIVVFEPRLLLGAGLAYDSAEPVHRINVPATRMSLLPDDPEQFQRWIESNDAVADDADARAADGSLFPRRGLFGRYMHEMIRPHVDSGAIRHVVARVAGVTRRGNRWHVEGDSGEVLDADIVVIATSHPAPSAPPLLADALQDYPRFVTDPTKPHGLDAIRRDDRVLIVGNGLTSADVVAALSLSGHRGPITAISRRGLRSRGHATAAQEPFGDFTTAPARTASALLKNIRAAIRAAAATGLTWHAVLDQVRAHGQSLWQGLGVAERRRIARHLRPYWDVHRFRIAPQVEAATLEAMADDRMEVLAASVADVAVVGDEIRCTLLRSRSQGMVAKVFDAVVVTTGPAHGGILRSQGFLAGLAAQGYLAIDPTGLGLDCDAASQAIGTSGAAMPSLYISGPLARGTFGELMGLPQVTEHAVFVADGIVARVLDDNPQLSRVHRM